MRYKITVVCGNQSFSWTRSPDTWEHMLSRLPQLLAAIEENQEKPVTSVTVELI